MCAEVPFFWPRVKTPRGAAGSVPSVMGKRVLRENEKENSARTVSVML